MSILGGSEDSEPFSLVMRRGELEPIVGEFLYLNQKQGASGVTIPHPLRACHESQISIQKFLPVLSLNEAVRLFSSVSSNDGNG